MVATSLPTRRFTASLIAFAFVLAAPAALAQVVSTIKTPPLANSSSIILPINIHIPVASPPFAGWAGALVVAHILDASELDIVAVTPLPPFAANVLGPPNSLFAPGSPGLR